MNTFKKLLLMSTVCLALGGCELLWHGGSYESVRQGKSSSLVDYLYPDGETPERPSAELPSLELPLRVGIAFVPSEYGQALAPVTRQALLDEVAARFRDRPYVSAIETIPDSYLKTARGKRGMQQVARMFDVDVMALVSYDQLSVSGERDSALLYWTVVGALMVKGNTNEVQTFIDTAVFDVDSTRLLFRAPGSHLVQKNSTLVDETRDRRNLQTEGFTLANRDMIVNLNHELEQLRTAVKEGQRAQVAWRPGSSGGGGASGIAFVALLLSVPGLRKFRRVTLRAV